jgi:outer membrane protein insertion porin family
LRINPGLALRVVLAVSLPVTTLPLGASQAQIQSGGTIKEVRVEGTQRVEPETVRSYLVVQAGDPFDAARIDKSLKSLYATGLFADVTLRRDGDALVVRVVENPVINRISFEGNHKLSDDTLNSEIQLRSRVVYTREKVQSDVKRILDLYRRNGRFAATVDPKVIPLEQNRVDLVFEISEGATTGVRSISFVGNHEFSASKLREIMETKESRWYRFLSSSDTYDPDRLTYDRELLRKFYLSQGYADFRVVSAIAELTPSRDGFFITFTVEEGARYRFGKLSVNSQIKAIDPAVLQTLLVAHDGDWYNADQVDKSITALTDALGNRGFAFVDIQPQVKRNAETRTIDITFNIKEGPKVFVERIDISGNIRTLDRVIRREFRLVEGDAFNTAKLQRSEQRIKNLGFFKKVDVTNVPGSTPDKTVINVNLEEQSTGEFSVGIGFSTAEGVLADIGIRERNLLGRGQDLRLETIIAQRTEQIDIGFTEPYFLERNLSAGVDVFVVQRDNTDFAGFQQFSAGTTFRAGYQIAEPLRQTLSYTAREDRVFNVLNTASLFIQEEQGSRITSSFGQQLLFDKRDNRLFPTTGFYVSLGNDLAGAGGDARYIRTSLSGGYYYPVAPEWVASLSGESGYIKGLGQGVAIQDRYFVGGDNLRGFAVGGIGPRDIVSDDALGGNIYYTGSAQLTVPTGLPKEFGVTGRIFSDFGTLYHIDQTTFVPIKGQPNPILKDSAALRVTTGVGATWISPMGPIRLDLAVPVKQETYDKKQFFWISFGSKF